MLVEQIAGFITRHQLIATGFRLGVAVSGGADSVCLLHALFELRSRWNLHLEAVHVNHLLRGADSDADEEFVRQLAQTLGLPVHSLRIDLAGLGSKLEETARDARRAVFQNLIRTVPLDRVALAHTRSDQAETVLFRFLRGSYTTGLAGMRPATADGLVRPMLEIERPAVEAWLRGRGIAWREDHTNQDQGFARNRIRHGLLPALAAEWNPSLPALLAQHATLAQEDEAYWEREIDRLMPLFAGRSGEAIIVTASEPFEGLAPALARRLIRRALGDVKGDLRQIDFRHIDAVLKLMRGPSGHFRLQVPGVDVLRSFNQVRFAPPRSYPSDRGFELTVTAPAVVALPGGETSLYLEIVDRAGKDATVTNERDTLGTILDWSRIQSDMVYSGNSHGELLLRNWRPGDAYRRAGDRHEQKLKALFHTARIPLWERRHWPVLSAGGRIIWTRGFGPAHDLAAIASTNLVLRISERAHTALDAAGG